MSQRVKNLPTMQKTGVQPLGQEDPLEKKMATHFDSMDRGGWWATVHGVAKSWTRLSDTHTHTHTHTHTRRWEETGLQREGPLRGPPHSCWGLAEVGTTVGLGLLRVGRMQPPHTPRSVGPQEMSVQLVKTTPTTFPIPNYSLKLAGSQAGPGSSNSPSRVPRKRAREAEMIPLKPVEKCIPSPVSVIDRVCPSYGNSHKSV